MDQAYSVLISVFPSCSKGCWTSQWVWVPAIPSEGKSSSSKSKSFIYELWKIQTSFSKARGSLGVCIPWKSGKCLSKFYFDFSWKQKYFFPVETDFFRLLIFLYTLLDIFPVVFHQKKKRGKKWQTKSSIPYSLPDKSLFQFLVWEPKSCNNGSSLPNLLKLDRIWSWWPAWKQEDSESKACVGGLK